LLVLQVSVGCYKHVETTFSCSQELAVGQARPAQVVSGFYLMSGEVLLKWGRRTLIKQDSHPDRTSGGLNAARCVLEDGVDLLTGDAGKPLHELVHGSASFDILEQGAHRYPRSAKDPCAADLQRVALDSLTGGPIQHGGTLL